MKLKIEDIAKVCHEANKALCEIHKDFSQKPWEETEEWQRSCALDGVIFVYENPEISDSGLHDKWIVDKINDGWKYGEKKDAAFKTHPCLVIFERLSAHQQAKDRLFIVICRSLFSLVPMTYGH